MNCKQLLIGSILISTLSLTSESSAQNEWLKWANEYGVPVHQGNSVRWNQAVATHSFGDLATAAVWEDTRNGCRSIAMQIFEEDGSPRFENGGILLHEPSGYRSSPAICADLETAWFVTWEYKDVHGQIQLWCAKIDANGEILWNRDEGGAIIASNGRYAAPQVVSDNAGGCIVIWQSIDHNGHALMAKHILSNGMPDREWNDDGIRISSEGITIFNPYAIPDEEGGIFVIWNQVSGWRTTIMAQRLNLDGDLVWNDGQPVTLSELPERAGQSNLVADGTGGIIAAWTYHHEPIQPNRDVIVQRLSPTGQALWQEGGEPLANSDGYEQNPRLVASGEGEAIVIWEYFANDGADIDLRAMKIGGDNGFERLWDDEDGVEVVTADNIQRAPDACTDGDGGAMIVWTDGRNQQAWKDSDVYVQHLTWDGEALFGPDAFPLCRSDQNFNSPVIYPTQEGFITIWSKGLHNTTGLVSRVIDIEGEPLSDPVDVLEAHPGGAYSQHLISTSDDEFAVAWLDPYLPPNPPTIYIRTFQENGDQLASNNGDGTTIVPRESHIISSFDLASAGNGGVIAVYSAFNYEIDQLVFRANKISREGLSIWGGEGVQIPVQSIDISQIVTEADGNGGVFIAWQSCSAPDYLSRIFCQRISSDGEILWADNGVELGDRDTECLNPKIVPDGEGGAVFLWREVDLSVDHSYNLLRANRISRDGVKEWGDDDLTIMAGEYNCHDLQLTRHPLGFFFAWSHSGRDINDRETSEIRGQMIDGNGELLWTAEGAVFATGLQYRGGIDVAIDPDGNIWLSWYDLRRDQGRGPSHIYYQKVDPSIVRAELPRIEFDEGGRNITSESFGQYENRLTSDGHGGVWFVWAEYTGPGQRDIRSMHLDASGEPYDGWPVNGITVCGEFFDQQTPSCVSLDGGSHGIATLWLDARSSIDDEGGMIDNLYIQRIDDGHGMHVKPADKAVPSGFQIVGLYPNPFNGQARLEYRLGSPAPVGIDVFDINGRQVFGQASSNRLPGAHSIFLSAENWTSGEYLAKVRAGNDEVTQRIVLVR